MKAAMLLLAALMWQAAPETKPSVVQPDNLRYERAITVPAGAREACAVLDAQVFPHAAPSLRDMRILPDGASGPAREIPYALTLSEAMTEETESARLLNLTNGAAHSIVFDLEMPQRAYTSVDLDLDPAMRDFVATATVSGSDSLGRSAKSTALGSFTVFDLSSQHLSRDTMLRLEESAFLYLHVVLSVAAANGTAAGGFSPAMVRGAEVPPSREAQTIYTTVAATNVTTVGRESRAEFTIPRRVPVERVSFVLAPGFKGNFSRDVRVSAIADAKPAADRAADGDVDEDTRAPLPEAVTGKLLRVQATLAGREVRAERLSIPAILGANLQRAAKVEVAIENGDYQPLPIASVRLEMRQRKLCFDAAPGAGAGLALYYGDPQLPPPAYGYERQFVATRQALVAELGVEQLNPEFRAPEAEGRPILQRHPEVLWMVLLAVTCAVGMVGLRRHPR
jgi:hypothetical protein